MGSYVPNVDGPSSFGTSVSIGNTVADRFSYTAQYADATFQHVLNYSGLLQDLLSTLVVPETDDIDITEPEIIVPSFANRPAINSLNLPSVWPTNTALKPMYIEVGEIDAVPMPAKNIDTPVWSTPEKPQEDDITEPGEAPVLKEITVSPRPVLNFPDEPTLQELAIPTKPQLTKYTFDKTLPTSVISEPATISWSESPFNSDVWDNLLNKVLDGLENGGTGILGETVEEDIWQRALDRQRIEDTKLLNDAEDYYAAKDMEMPNGAENARVTEILREIGRNKTNLNSDITVKQAQLAHEYSKWVYEQARELEKILRDFHNAQADRSFEYAKEVASNAIEILKAMIERHNLYIEEYKAEAQVFGEKIKAQYNEILIFKEEIEAARLTAEQQKILVEVYQMKLQALDLITKLYNSELQAAELLARLEDQRLQRYKLEVDVFVARLEGRKTKYDIYAKEVEAEGVKARTLESQVKAYVAEVEAAIKQVDLEIAKIEANIRRNDSETERYKAELEALNLEIEALAKQSNVMVEAYKGEVAAYAAENEREAGYYGVKINEQNMRIQEARFRLEKAVAQVDAATKGYIAVKELQKSGTETLLSFSTQLTASAWNAVNANASIGYSLDESKSQNWRWGESLSEAHNFEENPT